MTVTTKGIGLESEGFFINTEGHSIAHVQKDGELIPTSEYVLGAIAKQFPQLISRISPELVSVTLEVKSGVCKTFEEAVQEIFHYKNCINAILADEHFSYEFIPVLEKSYQAIPSLSSSDRHVSFSLYSEAQRKRIHRVLHEFGYDEAQQDEDHYFHGSTIASLQINDSRFMQSHEGNIDYQRVADLYNILLWEKETLLSLNTKIKNYQQKERIQCYVEFLTHLKQEQFIKRGYTTDEIVFPNLFDDVDSLFKYFATHADKDTFDEHMDSKDINGFMKFKPDIQATELRIIDSQNTPEDALKACHVYDTVLQKGLDLVTQGQLLHVAKRT